MNTRKASIKIYITVLAAMVLLVALYFANLSFVKANPGGLEFLAHWQGARSFLNDGVDPYSDQTAGIIRSLAGEIDPDDPGEYRFVAPLISLIFYAPFALIPEFTIARATWMTLLEASLLFSAFLVASWKGSKGIIPLIIAVLVLGLNFSSIDSLVDGNLSLVGFALIIGTIHLLLRNNDEGAGLLLALSLIKPENTYPVIFIVLIWVLIQKRYTVLWWFLAVFVIVLGFSLVLIPDWPVRYLENVIEYSARNPVRLEELAPTELEIRLIFVKNLIVGILIIFEWFVVKIQGKQRLLWNVGLLLAVLPWIGGEVHLEQTTFVFAALLIGLVFLGGIRTGNGNLAIQLISILLVISSWIFSGLTVKGISETWVKLWHSLILPGLAVVILYWSRWWIIQKEKFSIETFKLSKM